MLWLQPLALSYLIWLSGGFTLLPILPPAGARESRVLLHLMYFRPWYARESLGDNSPDLNIAYQGVVRSVHLGSARVTILPRAVCLLMSVETKRSNPAERSASGRNFLLVHIREISWVTRFRKETRQLGRSSINSAELHVSRATGRQLSPTQPAGHLRFKLLRLAARALGAASN